MRHNAELRLQSPDRAEILLKNKKEKTTEQDSADEIALPQPEDFQTLQLSPRGARVSPGMLLDNIKQTLKR